MLKSVKLALELSELSKPFLDTRIQILVLKESKEQRINPRLMLLHLDLKALEALTAVSEHRVANVQIFDLSAVSTFLLLESLNRCLGSPSPPLI